jgi:transcriptional regulator with XRE-family HTH domain
MAKSPSKAVQAAKSINDFVAILKERRHELGLNQAELAGLCGLSIEGLSKIERGEAAPKLSTVLRLIEILGGRLDIVWPTATTEANE